MSYDYHQNQVFTAPTVLSQQDATVMADFFNNNPNSNSNDSFPGYGVEAKSDFTAGSMAHQNVLSDSAIASSLGGHSHVNYSNHLPQQPTNNQIFSFDLGNIFPSGQQQPGNHTARDAVAGASALLGLSTSQEQANLLNANNYMTWQNIVGAQLQAPSNTSSTNTNTPGLHKGSNSQIHSQTQSPQLQQPLTSWAEVSAQAMQQRARHPSLQLDTTSTMPSHTHQQGWQNAPQSALPHVGSRRPAPVPRFGSDNAFSPHGYGSSSAPPIEDKHGIIPDSAMETATTPVQQRRQAHPSLMRHHSMSAAVPVPGSQQSPVINHHHQIMHSPYAQSQHLNQLGMAPGSARKRGFSAIDEGATTQNSVGRAPPVQDTKQLIAASKSNEAQVNADAEGTAPAPAAGGRRRAQREPKPPRQNLTDAQKRQNHIASEQKRRDTMKTNFDLLSKRVPIIRDSGAMSRSEILYHVANHIESAKTGNNVMCRVAGVTLEQLDAMSDSEDDDDADGENNE